jgi:hypothetical protein
MKLTPSQRLMVADGFPPSLFATQVQRAAHWLAHPPCAMPFIPTKTRDEDEATAAFRAQEEARKRQKSLASITRMKTRMAAKAVDHSRMRWDPRRSQFVPDTGTRCIENSVDNRSAGRKPDKSPPRTAAPVDARLRGVTGANPSRNVQAAVTNQDWSRVTKDTARALAELNGVWDAKYEKLSGGLLVMTVTNRLKGLVKRGGEVRWA